MGIHCFNVNILAFINCINSVVMSEIENIREYAAAMAEAERDKEIVAHEVDRFAMQMKNGLGEEIKEGVPSPPSNKISEFFKRLFNTCK